MAIRKIISRSIQNSTIATSDLADNAVTTAKITDNNITDAKISALSSSKLSGALPAISGASLTGIDGVSTGSIINTVTEYHTASTEISTSFTTYISPLITPTATNSKILILATICVDIIGDSNFTARLARSIGGASNSVLNPDIGNSFYGSGNLGNANQHGLGYAIIAIDSPNTTSAVEYKLQMYEQGNTARVLLSHSGDSSVTLMEIKG